MNRYFITMVVVVLILMFLVSCRSEKGDDGQECEETTVPVEMTIALPKAGNAATRTGDPGASTGEGTDWDRLTIIIAYTEKATGNGVYDAEPRRMVYYDTFTKEEFDCLHDDGTLNVGGVEHQRSMLVPVIENGQDTGIRQYTMYLPQGTAQVYGVTYTHGQLDIESRLDNMAADGTDRNREIENMTISNAYAAGTDGTVAKMLSVATGYALNVRDALRPTRQLTIKNNNNAEMRQYWSMTLTRLAAKIDVQWDAQSAFDSGAEIEGVTGFAYNGRATTDASGNALVIGDQGSGRLFPALATDATPLGGKTVFLNTTAVSKRNGRAYHYVFPDSYAITATGSLPQVSVQVTGKDGGSGSVTVTKTLQFASHLLSAAWYKVNANVKGVAAGDQTITLEVTNQ